MAAPCDEEANERSREGVDPMQAEAGVEKRATSYQQYEEAPGHLPSSSLSSFSPNPPLSSAVQTHPRPASSALFSTVSHSSSHPPLANAAPRPPSSPPRIDGFSPSCAVPSLPSQSSQQRRLRSVSTSYAPSLPSTAAQRRHHPYPSSARQHSTPPFFSQRSSFTSTSTDRSAYLPTEQNRLGYSLPRTTSSSVSSFVGSSGGGESTHSAWKRQVRQLEIESTTRGAVELTTATGLLSLSGAVTSGEGGGEAPGGGGRAPGGPAQDVLPHPVQPQPFPTPSPCDSPPRRSALDTSTFLATPCSPSFSPAAFSLSDPRTSSASPYSSSLFPYSSTTSPFASPASSPPSLAGFSVEASTAGGFGRGFDGAEHAGPGLDEADDLVDEGASTTEAAFTPRGHHPAAPAPAPSFSFTAAPAPAPPAPELASTRADVVECGRGIDVAVGAGAVEAAGEVEG